MSSKVVKVLIIVLLFLFVFFFLYMFILRKDFLIEGYDYNNSTIYEIVNYKEKYNDTGIKVKYGNKVLGYKDVEVKKEKEKVIDTTKAEVFENNYIVKYKNKVKKVKKTIIVKDISSPIIKAENKSVDVCPGSNVVNVIYKADDNYDGDVTSNVEKIIEGNYVLLKVSDSNGNTSEEKVLINYVDNINPSIKLNGNDTVYLKVGDKYNEAGAISQDNCDGDISSNIKMTSNVDTSKAGTYNVIYSAEDKEGNKNTITRQVIVSKAYNKVIYLTFDDGPSAYTDKLLNILSKYNVKATFFVTASKPAYSYLIKKEYDAGHTIGAHSYTHSYSYIYSSVDNYFDDLNRINELIKNQTGSETKIIRFPGGSSNTVSRQYSKGIMTKIVSELNNKGYVYFDWNVSSGDAGNTTNTNQIVTNVVNAMNRYNTMVVLQHDNKLYSINAVESIIIQGLNRGYTFKALDVNSFNAHHGLNN